ncbi:MAG: NADH-quinone oxidoreductase subunit NuoH, partial [Anaerolineales bacterium]
MSIWSDPLAFIGSWLESLLVGWGLNQTLAQALVTMVGVVVLITALMVWDIFLVWIERKVVARFQDRLGPNRVGPFGIIQPFADILKLITKEDITPKGAEKFLYNLAPILSLLSVLLLWAVVPLAPTILGVDLNVALVFLVAVGALGTLAIIMAGWASNNKYALLGAFRQVAAMIAYEIPMVVALLIPTILAGTMGIKGVVEAQRVWFVVLSPLGMLIFLISAVAELGRSPFDLNEAESEIVAGFHIEYSGMKFGLFYAGELLHAFTFGALIGILFFGGWKWPLPFGERYALIGLVNVFIKGMFFYWVIMWIRYTMMRIRIDHMLYFSWKFLTPLSFVLLIVTALVHSLMRQAAYPLYVLSLFLANLLVAWVTIEIL